MKKLAKMFFDGLFVGGLIVFTALMVAGAVYSQCGSAP